MTTHFYYFIWTIFTVSLPICITIRNRSITLIFLRNTLTITTHKFISQTFLTITFSIYIINIFFLTTYFPYFIRTILTVSLPICISIILRSITKVRKINTLTIITLKLIFPTSSHTHNSIISFNIFKIQI